MDYDLKPCPFCGGKARIANDNKWGSITLYSHVVCTNFKCGISGKWIAQSTTYSSDELAAQEWNRRV